MKHCIHFELPDELVRRPFLHVLSRQFDVVVNIRGASVTADSGFFALELEGEKEEIDRVMEHLRGRGLDVADGLGDVIAGA